MNSGDSATFNCSVTGSPIESIWWLRNAEPVLSTSDGEAPTGSRVRLLSQQVLHVSGVSRSDRGMYQCFVRNDRESAQGSAELRLGGELTKSWSTHFAVALCSVFHTTLTSLGVFLLQIRTHSIRAIETIDITHYGYKPNLSELLKL